LHLAAESGSKDVAAVLVANKADVNAKDNDGATPLDDAASSGNWEVVELLVANKAEVANIYDAAACGDLDRIMKFLKDDPTLVFKKYSFDEQLTPLHFASLNGQKDATVLLLSRKSDVNAANNVGATPLHCAAAHGHAEVAAVLLDNNANVNAEDNAGATPLDWALAKGMPFGRAVAEGSNDVADVLRKHGGIATGKHW
jgi:ankyrin repeat protein